MINLLKDDFDVGERICSPVTFELRNEVLPSYPGRNKVEVERAACPADLFPLHPSLHRSSLSSERKVADSLVVSRISLINLTLST